MSEARDTVPFGTPITSRQAALAVLRLIQSPVVGDVNADPDPGYTVTRLSTAEMEHMLSSGEKRLRDIALSLWTDSRGADVAALGGLDRTTCRKVWVILGYRFLGDTPWSGAELSPPDFETAFGGGRS